MKSQRQEHNGVNDLFVFIITVKTGSKIIFVFRKHGGIDKSSSLVRNYNRERGAPQRVGSHLACVQRDEEAVCIK